MYSRRESPLQDSEPSQGHSTEFARRVTRARPDRLFARFEARGFGTYSLKADHLSRPFCSPLGPPRGPDDELTLLHCFRLAIHGEREEPKTTTTPQPSPPHLPSLTVDRREVSHRRYPTTSHSALNLQHRESNIRSSPRWEPFPRPFIQYVNVSDVNEHPQVFHPDRPHLRRHQHRWWANRQEQRHILPVDLLQHLK